MKPYPFQIICDEQRTPEWHRARVGMVTGTDAKALLSRGKGSEESVGRRDLRAGLVAERLTGESQDEAFVTKEMQCGAELEPDAIAAYELATDCSVQPVGFIRHLDMPVGCSLDGHVNDFTGFVEVKCPKTATHFGYLRANRVPPDYLPQITHNLFVSGAQWCDFVSFDPRLPEQGRLFVKRIIRAEVDLAAYDLALRLFLGEVDKEYAEIERLIGLVTA